MARQKVKEVFFDFPQSKDTGALLPRTDGSDYGPIFRQGHVQLRE